MLQQKTGEHVRLLTIITVIFYPATLAAGIFSMQDTVLPPNPSLLGYIMTTVLLILTMLAILTLSLGWTWYQHIQNFAGPSLSIGTGLVRKSWCYGKGSSHSAVDVANQGVSPMKRS